MFFHLYQRPVRAVISGLFAVFFTLSGNALAADNACQQQGVHIAEAQIRATPPNAPVTGGYLHILNKGDAAQRLISAHAEFSHHTELHEMKQQDGVMKMAPLANGINIDAGEEVQLKPGGLHIMFMHLTEQLVPSQMHQVTLMFDGCGALPATFMVVKNPGKEDAHSASGTHKHTH